MQNSGGEIIPDHVPVPNRRRITARYFYGLIFAGVLLGVALSSFGGWTYLQSGHAKPIGRHIWEDDGNHFIIPISIMIGGTFGGIMGVVVAIVASSRTRGAFLRGDAPLRQDNHKA